MSQVPDGPRSPEMRPAAEPGPRGAASGYEPSRPAAPSYSPPPGTSTPTDKVASRQRRRGLGIVAVAAVAVGLAVGAWYGLSSGGAGGSLPPVSAAKESKTFSVSMPDLDAKATEQLKAMLSGSADAATVEGLKAANGQALAALAKTSPEMAQEISSGRRVLYRVYLLDFLAQDGDRAELFFNGISFGNIDLKNAGTSILLPVMAGMPAQMKLVATADGGGGVTVAFISSLGEARTRVMQVGDYDQWQVLVR